MMEQRRPKYEAAADVVVNTDYKTVEEIAEEIVSEVNKRCRLISNIQVLPLFMQMEDERMHGFTQYTPTRIIFGKETQKQVGELAKSLKASKVFVVYGGGSVVRSGLLDEVTASLEEAGLEYMTVGGVKPNPRLSIWREKQ